VFVALPQEQEKKRSQRLSQLKKRDGGLHSLHMYLDRLLLPLFQSRNQNLKRNQILVTLPLIVTMSVWKKKQLIIQMILLDLGVRLGLAKEIVVERSASEEFVLLTMVAVTQEMVEEAIQVMEEVEEVIQVMVEAEMEMEVEVEVMMEAETMEVVAQRVEEAPVPQIALALLRLLPSLRFHL